MEQKFCAGDRFCIAHQLAHFLLISRYGWNPQEQSRYWDTEAMCDFFARELLVPAAEIGEADCHNALTALAMCNHITMRTEVPWIQVAKKMSEANPALVLLRLEERKGRLTVVSTSLPRERGRGIKLNRSAEFVRIADQMGQSAAHNAHAMVRALSRNHFLGGKLGLLFSDLIVTDIAGEASAFARSFKLVAVRDRPAGGGWA